MRLLDRLTTLVKADAHGVLESLEDRRLLAKQLLREARLALDDKRAQVAGLKTEQHRLELEAKRLAAIVRRLDEEVAMAMDSNEDQLARAAVRKLLPLREAHRRLNERLVALHDEEVRATSTLVIQERDYELLKARLQAELALADTRRPDDVLERQVITDDDVELELLRRRQSAKTEVDMAPPQAAQGDE